MASLSQIRAQVASIVRRLPEARVIGIRTVNGWKGNSQINVSDREFRVVYCASELQIREALLDAGATSTPIVVVTNLEEGDLGHDVVVRFTRRRLHSVEGWTILKDVFQAREIDPSLLRRPWLADFVMDVLPLDGVDPVPTGVLDAETVWSLILRKSLGFGTSRPDAQDLLQWSLDASNLSRMGALSLEMRGAIREWIEGSAGRMAGAVLDCVDAGLGADAFPVGLAFGTVFADASFPELKSAAARLERYTGGRPIHDDLARSWADAAKALYDRLSSQGADHQVMAVADRSDQILREVRADSYAWLSDYSRLGFELRLGRLGDALTETLSSESEGVLDDLLKAAESVQRHRWSERFPARASQVEMAVRVVQWLKMSGQSAAPELQSLEDAALAYARDGGFVDWARQSLYYGDPVDAVSSAYSQLCEAVAELRQAQNRRFAGLFESWMAAGSRTKSTVLIEDVVRTIVAPAAQAAPVLLLVIDGMSYAVYRELVDDIRSTGWVEVMKKGDPPLKPVIAALPSVTEVCRRSLLSGKLTTGNSEIEKPLFSGQSDLLKVSKAGVPPVLFQKADLSDTGGATVAADLRREIASSKRRVVAVIVNAVDDHLLKGEQVAVPWTLRHLPVLSHLLAAAMESGRFVVMTSDHGHVLERRTVFRAATAGERYRLDDGDVAEGEIRIKGTRVVLPPEGTLIAPWSENIRYGSKRNGYHGGVSPQECVIPLSLLCWPTLVPEGFEVVAPSVPDWWIVGESERQAPQTVPVPPVAAQSAPQYSERGQAELPFVAVNADLHWIEERLLASQRFASQMKRAGRAAPSVERMRQILTAVDERGGTILMQALAQKLGEPELRMRGLVAAVQRILNVEGYVVLTFDVASGSIVLNQQLLEVQFELNHGDLANG